MKNQPTDPDLEIKWEAIRARQEQWLKDVEHIDEDGLPGRVLGPQNATQLKQIEADLAECAEDNDAETTEEENA